MSEVFGENSIIIRIITLFIWVIIFFLQKTHNRRNVWQFTDYNPKVVKQLNIDY